MKMTKEQMLEYIVKFDGMDFHKDNLEQAQEIKKKLTNLVKQFGFESCGSRLGFTYNYGYYYTEALRKGELDTRWFKLVTEGYDYIKVSIGVYAKKKEYGRGRNKRSYVVAYKGVCAVEEVKVPLNPKTNEPWKIGDVDDSNPNYTTVLTRHGWWSGD